MQVVRTISDLNVALASGTVAQCGFRRKKPGELHAGHVACVSTAKAIEDICLVTFYPHQEIMNYMYDISFPVPSDWDEDYCLDFCEDNFIDVVFIPTLTEVQNTFFNGVDIPSLNSTVSGIMHANGYFGNSTTMMEYAIAMEYLRFTKNVHPRNLAVMSLKDGFLTFARRHYCETVIGTSFTIVDAVYRSDGLPESSTFSTMSSGDVSIIAQMYQVAQNKTFDYLYALNDFTDFMAEVNYYSTPSIYADGLLLYKEGVIGENGILMELYIRANNKGIDRLVVFKEREQ